MLSSRHRDISSIPKISLCSQLALNITESTLHTPLYLTFWELADICSHLYRGVIEIQHRCESCKEQENCSEEYSVPHRHKPQQHTRTNAVTSVHTLVTSELAWKTHCHGNREKELLKGGQYWQEGKFRSISLEKENQKIDVWFDKGIYLVRNHLIEQMSLQSVHFYLYHDSWGVEVNQVKGRQCAE